MRVNTCQECKAANRLQDTRCWNCGADITGAGKFKSFVQTIIILAIIIGVLILIDKN